MSESLAKRGLARDFLFAGILCEFEMADMFFIFSEC